MKQNSRNELIDAARSAREKAYAPYSRFRVGAAVSVRAGIVVGCNVENASYGLTICAERSAIFAAVVCGDQRVDRIAISADSPDGGAANLVPCGACLQVLSEFMDGSGEVIIDGGRTHLLRELLPQGFTLGRKFVE